MYLQQQNTNLSNLTSAHPLNSLNNSLNMSDLHNDAFHHLNSTQSTVVDSSNHFNSTNAANNNNTTMEQNEENYIENYAFQSNGKLHNVDQFDYEADRLSCSPNSLSANTLNNITNISNLIFVNSNLNKLNQLADHTNQIDKIKLNQVDPNDIIAMDPMTRFLSLHPKYLELFDKFYNFLFNGDGPLQYTVRHYIAIMAAARHHCKYLVRDQQEQFKKIGGDLKWLDGLEYAPKKIQNLNEINKILAHQPWLLTKEHIERLTKGDDNWSLSELVQAIVIMTQFHSLASFVFGCGFNDADLDWSTKATNLTAGSNLNSNNISDLLQYTTNLPVSSPPSPPSPNSLVNGLIVNESNLNATDQSSMDTTPTIQLECDLTMNVNQQTNLDEKANSSITNKQTKTKSLNQQQANTLDILMLKMQSISQQKADEIELENQEELVKNQSLEINLTPTQVLSNIEFNFDSSSTSNSSSQHSTANTSPSQVTSKCLGNDDGQLSRFTFDTKFCYADFARQRAHTDVTTFKVQDYSWQDHAYSLVNRLYSDVGTMLDEKFTTIYNLTYYTMGRVTNIDTRLFRQAIWNYIQSMYGIRHDDYHYREINELLERPLKAYIKTVCCFPHQTRKKDCDTVLREFRRSEKIHVNVMIAEAKLQAELLYALRTISRYMT